MIKNNEFFSGAQHKELYKCKSVDNNSCILKVKEVESGYSYMLTFSKGANVE